MNLLALIFFALFAGVIVGIYLTIRRRAAAPGLIAAGGMVGSVLTMTLFSLAQNNLVVHALLVGLLVGGGFAALTMALAWYFLSNELRAGEKRPNP
ncbi:MAG: hypothetical protein MUE40_02850 [Anaerolineae bacterium]|jgi:hypothetical protein|nr:hypothetical protein [Anaerolineae bacterium]